MCNNDNAAKEIDDVTCGLKRRVEITERLLKKFDLNKFKGVEIFEGVSVEGVYDPYELIKFALASIEFSQEFHNQPCDAKKLTKDIIKAITDFYNDWTNNLDKQENENEMG